MFGGIMPQSKSMYKVELQKQTFSVAKTGFFFPYSFLTLTLLPQKKPQWLSLENCDLKMYKHVNPETA